MLGRKGGKEAAALEAEGEGERWLWIRGGAVSGPFAEEGRWGRRAGGRREEGIEEGATENKIFFCLIEIW